MKTEHFKAEYVTGIDGFCIINETESAYAINPDGPFYLYANKDEVTQSAINWIVENLNKLAEHNAKKDVVS
tara:strand:- start:30 stop:242 length:213 start_codon:yes stop_codon:yes gene_type:complete